MRDEDRIRLKHMIDACEAAVHFVTERTREDLDNDRMLFFAVVRAVEISGEAASKISEGTPARSMMISRGAPLQGCVTVWCMPLSTLDANIIWVAVTEEIPALLSRLQAVVGKE